MTERKKVLHINRTSEANGGVAMFLMNLYKHFGHDSYQLDFLTPDTTPFNPWRKEIECAGDNIYDFHIDCSESKGIREFGRHLRAFLSEHPYDIVHINCGAVFFDCVTAVAAKASGAKVVVHSHNTGERSWWRKPPIYFLKRRMQNHADVLCACSEEAARFIFTSGKVDHDEVIMINNGIDLQKFCYDAGVRSRTRQELHIADQLVVGHVGRFVEQKNHEFLIAVFAEINRRQPDAVLVLIGEGELEAPMREKVQNLKLDKQVLFLGQRDDVENLYQAMDVFLFPSLFEGLPISLVEAQESGLPCCISDTITKEVDLTSLIYRMSLRDSVQEWAEKVLFIAADQEQRHSREQELCGAGFGIENTAEQITQIYDRLMQGHNK